MIHNSAMRIPALIVAGTLLLAGCGLDAARAGAVAEAEVQPLNQANDWLPGLVAMPDYKASGLGPVGYPRVVAISSELDPTQEFLASIGLQAEDFASDIEIQLIQQGDTLVGKTLDFCGGVFPSEKLRLARRQVAAVDADGNYLGFSSEAVQYESAEAAQQAIDEMIVQKSACKDGSTFTADDGIEYTVTFYPAPGPESTILVPNKQRIILHIVAKSELDSTAYLLALQIRGNTLLGLYASAASDVPFDQETLDALFAIVSMGTQRLQAATPENIGEF